MKNGLLSILLFIGYMCKLYSQDNRPVKPAHNDKDKIKWQENVYWGGNLGLQLYGSTGMIDISPNAGYKLNKYVSGGIQLIYTNIWAHYSNSTYRYKFYGAGLFARVKPLNFLFLQAEYDLLNVPDVFGIQSSKRTFADVPMAGVGLINQPDDNLCYYMLLMYEYAPTPNSPYTYGPFGSPIIYRFGFNVNF